MDRDTADRLFSAFPSLPEEIIGNHAARRVNPSDMEPSRSALIFEVPLCEGERILGQRRP